MPHEDPSEFTATNLVQLAWALPLLKDFRKGVVVWTRPVAAQVGAAGGYSIGKVFGQNLKSVVQRILAGRPDLANPILNFALRRWLPSILLDVRLQGQNTLNMDEAEAILRQAYGHNPRYWLFTYPVLTLPLPLAKLYEKAGAAISKLIYMLRIPSFWRKQTT